MVMVGGSYAPAMCVWNRAVKDQVMVGAIEVPVSVLVAMSNTVAVAVSNIVVAEEDNFHMSSQRLWIVPVEGIITIVTIVC